MKLRIVRLRNNPAVASRPRRQRATKRALAPKARRYRRNAGQGAEPSFNIRMAQTRRGADHYNKLTGTPRAYDDPLDSLDEFPGDRIERERRRGLERIERGGKIKNLRRRRRRSKVIRRGKSRRRPAARKATRQCRGAARYVVQVFEKSGSRVFRFHYLKGSKLVPAHATPETFASAATARAAAARFMSGAPAKYPAAQVIKA